jgi:hypothetical protein
VFIGNYFEWNVQTGTMTKYYYAGAERIAMRTGSGSENAGLVWILGDHLGSTSITVDAATGARLSELRYKPWGEVRYEWGVTGTRYQFTGQKRDGPVEYTFLTVSGDTETTQFGDKPAISATTENITYEAFYSAKVYDGAISVTIEENWNISFDPISSDTTVWTNIRVPSETAPEPYSLTLGPITAEGDGARITRDIPIPGGSVDSTPFVEIVIYTPSAFLGSDIFRYLFPFYR